MNPHTSLDSRARPLRVLLVLDTRAWAGTESHVLTLAQALRSLGAAGAPPVEVSIAAPPDSPLARRARESGLRVVPIARRGTRDPRTLSTLIRRLRRGATDVVHVHNGRTALWGTLAVRLARRGACVATHHFIAPAHAGRSGFQGRVSGWLHRVIERGVAGHIAISGAVAQALRERGEVEEKRLRVVWNGIEEGNCLTSSQSQLPPELRAEIVCVARLQKEKGLPTLVRAMALLNAGRIEPIRCVVAGEGDERGALEELIAQHPTCNVHLAGFTAHVPALLDGARVAVLPSPAEPFGLALLEAMRHAKPVVAVDAGGPREIVLDGATGRLVLPEDERAMAKALEELLADPVRARQMGEQGRARLKDHFSARRMGSETLEVYRRALD